jgi:DNA-binding MarR family transcriptional regulator
VNAENRPDRRLGGDRGRGGQVHDTAPPAAPPIIDAPEQSPRAPRQARPLGPLRQARAEALATLLAEHEGSYILGFLLDSPAVRQRNSGGWSRASLERAIDDLAAAGRLELAPGGRGIRLKLTAAGRAALEALKTACRGDRS